MRKRGMGETGRRVNGELEETANALQVPAYPHYDGIAAAVLLTSNIEHPGSTFYFAFSGVKSTRA